MVFLDKNIRLNSASKNIFIPEKGKVVTFRCCYTVKCLLKRIFISLRDAVDAIPIFKGNCFASFWTLIVTVEYGTGKQRAN
ncbi:MAG: hypothetical protein MRJ65_09580 [Candidatus Brocadiaceae bacterium]|nr:hypothetical protein [Candidatus Brocadiaceae bacterium]